MSLIITKLGGRRFLLTLISEVGTWALCMLGHIDGTAYQWTTIGIVGAYITGNVTQKIKAPGQPGE